MIKRETPQTGKAFREALVDLKKPKRLAVGYFSNQMYPARDKIPAKHVATVAYEQDQGTQEIPATYFFSGTVEEKKENWRKRSITFAKYVIKGKITYDEMLNRLGLTMQGDVQKKIVSINSPPLKTATVKARLKRLKGGGVRRRKGDGPNISLTAAKRLVDTGTLQKSTSYKILNE